MHEQRSSVGLPTSSRRDWLVTLSSNKPVWNFSIRTSSQDSWWYSTRNPFCLIGPVRSSVYILLYFSSRGSNYSIGWVQYNNWFLQWYNCPIIAIWTFCRTSMVCRLDWYRWRHIKVLLENILEFLFFFSPLRAMRCIDQRETWHGIVNHCHGVGISKLQIWSDF